MKRFYSLSLASLAVLTALPAVAAGSFIGSDDDSANNVTEDTTINATGVLTYTNSDKQRITHSLAFFQMGSPFLLPARILLLMSTHVVM